MSTRFISIVVALLIVCLNTAFAQSPQGVITTPTPGSTLSSSSVTFGWTAGGSASAYWLTVGSTAGGDNYYSSGNLDNVLTAIVNGLPTNGSTLYLTLYSLIGGAWVPSAYTYTALNAAASGVITTPTPGSTLSGSGVTFGWTAGAGASAYWLVVGSTAGGTNYYSAELSGLTATVNGLPTNGSKVYVTLYSLIGGAWVPNAYTYTAVTAAAGGVITTPAPGSTLNSSSVAFGWTAGAGASAYWLVVGSTAGGDDYYSSGNLGNVLTATVGGLPTNGNTIYVTLYSLIGGAWVPNACTYTALSAAAGGVITTPTPGSTLSGSSVTVNWTAGAGASAYWLVVGSTAGGDDYYSSGNLGLAQTTTVSTLPANGSTIYVTLYSDVGGRWVNNAYTYVSGPLQYAVIPTVSGVSPNSGTTAGGTAVAITGTNFAAGAAVTFGGAVATNVSVVSSTTIMATTPAGSAGAVTVTVTVSGQSGSLTYGFTYATSVPGLVAAYSFDEGTGTTVGDSSGNGNTGTIVNATWTTAGAYGDALQFNGTNSWVIINDAASLDLTTGMTLEAWVNPFAIPLASCSPTATCPWMDVVYKDIDRYYIEGSSNDNGGLSPYGEPEAGGIFADGKHIVYGPSALPLNAWTHLALTYDSTMIRFYVNGFLVASLPETTPITTSTSPLFIGGDQTMGQFFNGVIDEVRVYNVALTAAQIQSDMNTSIVPQVPNNRPPTISYAQGNSATPQTFQTTVSVPFTAAQTAGDLNVVAVGWNNSTSTVSAVTDTSGNTYTLAVGPTILAGLATQSIYYAKNIASAEAGTNAVTVTFSTAAVAPDIRILEYSGADPNNPVDVAAADSGSSATSSSGAVTTTNATDLVFGANYVQTLTSGPGTGFTSLLLTSPDGDIAEDEMVTATGSYAATAPLSSGWWIMQMVAFRAP